MTEPARLGTGVILPKLGFFFAVLTTSPLILLDIKSSLQFFPTCCWIPEEPWTSWTVVLKIHQLRVSVFPPVISQHQAAAPSHYMVIQGLTPKQTLSLILALVSHPQFLIATPRTRRAGPMSQTGSSVSQLCPTSLWPCQQVDNAATFRMSQLIN